MAASQRETLRIFTALQLMRQAWPGSLLLGVGLNDAGRALALASLAAGAASLFLEEDQVMLRAAQREGCCTCTLTSLDEALRVLKNEVRQRRAVSVALRGQPAAWLVEMVGRGVQPQVVAALQTLSEQEACPVQVLRDRGMQALRGLDFCPAGTGSVDLGNILDDKVQHTWTLREQPAASLVERRSQDADLLAAAGGDDAISRVNRKWMSAAPTLFPRALERWYWNRG